MDKLQNFLMEYVVYGKDGGILKKGKIKAKNKRSEFEAKAGFGKHIEKKYGDKLGRLEITTCHNDLFGGIFDGIFGKDNPLVDNPFSNFGDMFK